MACGSVVAAADSGNVTVVPLPGDVLLAWDETDIIERALVVALYHRQRPADGKPLADTCRSLFDELRRVSSTEQPAVPDPRGLVADSVRLRPGG